MTVVVVVGCGDWNGNSRVPEHHSGSQARVRIPHCVVIIPQQRIRSKMLCGLIAIYGSSADSYHVDNFALAAVCRLTRLLATFDRLVTTFVTPIIRTNRFLHSPTPLWCSHASGNSNIILGLGWVSSTGSVFCGDVSRLLDTPRSSFHRYRWINRLPLES